MINLFQIVSQQLESVLDLVCVSLLTGRCSEVRSVGRTFPFLEIADHYSDRYRADTYLATKITAFGV